MKVETESSISRVTKRRNEIARCQISNHRAFSTISSICQFKRFDSSCDYSFKTLA